MSAQVGESRLIPEWSLGDRLRKIRRVTGYGQAEFAKQLGENAKTYAAWELDTSAPRNIVAVAKKIEMLSGVPAAWVLGVDVPAPSTGVSTSRYTAGSRGRARTLTLVTCSPMSNPGVDPRYGSSTPGPGYDASPVAPLSTRTVNNADAA